MNDQSLSSMTTQKGISEDPCISLGEMATVSGIDNNVTLGFIDRYELKEELGAGGFGSVYRALDQVTGIDVAIKVLPPMLAAIPAELENVRKNYALVSKLNHPNIASVHHLHQVEAIDEAASSALGISKGSYIVVMEFIHGYTLDTWRKQFPNDKVPTEKVLDIGLQIAEALDHAHSEMIVHRDIKPSNVMVTVEGRVKILDFGLAAEIRSTMTRVSKEIGDTSGTRPYMAPEQWVGKRQSGKTDQYSLTCLLYELLSGHVPFYSVYETGDTLLMMNVIKTEEPEEIEELSNKENKILLTGLSKNPEDRFESCSDLIEAFNGKVKVKKKSSSKKKKSGSSPVLKIAAGIAIIAIGIAGSYPLWRGLLRDEYEMQRAQEKMEEVKQLSADWDQQQKYYPLPDIHGVASAKRSLDKLGVNVSALNRGLTALLICFISGS